MATPTIDTPPKDRSRRQVSIRLTPVERDHILNLLYQNEQEGVYWGNRAQYWERHSKIAEKFEREE